MTTLDDCESLIKRINVFLNDNWHMSITQLDSFYIIMNNDCTPIFVHNDLSYVYMWLRGIVFAWSL